MPPFPALSERKMARAPEPASTRGMAPVMTRGPFEPSLPGQEIFELLQGESGEQIAQQVEVALDAVEAYEEGLDEED